LTAYVIHTTVFEYQNEGTFSVAWFLTVDLGCEIMLALAFGIETKMSFSEY
jgi:hypothetical protein